jgi:hypothetical protein
MCSVAGDRGMGDGEAKRRSRYAADVCVCARIQSHDNSIIYKRMPAYACSMAHLMVDPGKGNSFFFPLPPPTDPGRER